LRPEISEDRLIGPDCRQAEFSQLSPGGGYRVVLPDAEGISRSMSLPGCWL